MTWVENNRDKALAERFIEDLVSRPLADIAADAYVAEALQPLLARHEQNIAAMRRLSCLDKGVATTDLIPEGIATINKFIVYYLHPEARYAVTLLQTPSATRFRWLESVAEDAAHPRHRQAVRTLRWRRPSRGGRHLATQNRSRGRAQGRERSRGLLAERVGPAVLGLAARAPRGIAPAAHRAMEEVLRARAAAPPAVVERPQAGRAARVG
jgi:hypothetical protein